jgi:hypothetical protein
MSQLQPLLDPDPRAAEASAFAASVDASGGGAAAASDDEGPEPLSEAPPLPDSAAESTALPASSPTLPPSSPPAPASLAASVSVPPSDPAAPHTLTGGPAGAVCGPVAGFDTWHPDWAWDQMSCE